MIIAVKGARVSDYNGKSLNASDEACQIIFNPSHKAVQPLKEWYIYISV